jgi:hypothetical protein
VLTTSLGLLVGGVPGSIGGTPTSGLASWDGMSWLGFGPGATVVDVAQATSGAIAVVTGSHDVRQWTGTAWVTLGVGLGVQTVAFAPNGDVLVGGSFGSFQGVMARRLARWRAASSTWAAVAGGMDTGAAGAGVCDLRVLSAETMLVGGGFTTVDGAGGAALATVRTPCAATVSRYGTGCTGATGTNTLQALTLPWLGTTLRSLAMAMPANGFALHLLGGAQLATPLAALTPLGGAGCELLVTPDALRAFVLSAGAIVLDLTIPNTAALAGVTFHEQVVAVELSTSGAITRFTSSNGVTATIGSW